MFFIAFWANQLTFQTWNIKYLEKKNVQVLFLTHIVTKFHMDNMFLLLLYSNDYLGNRCLIRKGVVNQNDLKPQSPVHDCTDQTAACIVISCMARTFFNQFPGI